MQVPKLCVERFVATVKLINFDKHDQYDAANELLHRLGFVVDLGEFLIEHLTEVLRRQHATFEIESIELLQIYDCSLGGMPNPDSTLITVDTYSGPLDVAVVGNVGAHRFRLKLHVVIGVTGENGRYTNVVSDVFVREQTVL